MRRLLLSTLVICTLIGLLAPAMAERRVALVIGNNAYPNLTADKQLNNAVADARAMREALAGLGFEVIYGENLDRGSLVDRVFDLAAKLDKGDVAFFFFAGHGVSLSGANYLLPSDIPAARVSGRAEEGRLAERAVAETTILQRITATGARVAVVVLDACRNNPLQTADLRAVGESRGLVRAAEVKGVFSIYSAGFGQLALDRLPGDAHPNSVFTRVFIEKLKTPGLDLKSVATQTRREVVGLAQRIGHDQVPAYYDQIVGGDIYLAGLPAAGPKPVPTVKVEPGSAVAPVDTDAAARRDFEFAERMNTKEVWEEFLRKYPTGLHAAAARARLAALVPPRVSPVPEPTPSRPAVVTSPPPEEILKTRPLPASSYPTRTVTIIVPYAPGGPADLTARIVATKLSELLGQQFVIENRAGGGGTIGASAVARAAPDGYSLLLGDTTTLSTSPSLYKSLPYDPQRDFVPVGLVAKAPLVLVVAPKLRVRTLSDLTAHAKKNPGGLNLGSTGVGALPHLAGEQLKLATGTELIHIPFKGFGPLQTELANGRIDVSFLPVSSAAPWVKGGQVRAIAVAGPRRAAELRDVPTFTESGLKGFEAGTSYGILAPKGTPADVIAKLNVSLGNALLTDQIRTRLQTLGLQPEPTTPEGHGAAIRQEVAVWSKVIQQAGIKAQ